MKARYLSAWKAADEWFLGCAGEIDVYYECGGDEGEHFIYVVGPGHRTLRNNGSNFDVYVIEDGGVLSIHEETFKDIHVELSEMCEIYQLIQEKGLLNGLL